MQYPDPFDREAFGRYLDHYPAHRLTLDQMRDETAHWAEWIAKQNLIASEPSPRALVKVQSSGLTITGVVIGLFGPLGFISGSIGTIFTAAGFVTTVWGFFISANLRAEKQEPARAAERVKFRIDELVHRRKKIQQQRDLR